jgi:hypothetical protein
LRRNVIKKGRFVFMDATVNEEEVLGVEYTKEQLDEYRRDSEGIILNVLDDQEFITGIWKKLACSPIGGAACDQFMCMINCPDLIMLLLRVIEKTAEWEDPGPLRPVSAETVRYTLRMLSEILSNPEKSVRELDSSEVGTFSEWPERIQVKYLFFELLIKQRFNLPRKSVSRETLVLSRRACDLMGRMKGVTIMQQLGSLQGVLGLDVLLRMHTIMGLMAKIFNANPIYMYTPLLPRFAVGYAIDVLQVLSNHRLSVEQRHNRRAEGLLDAGWKSGKVLDVDNKITYIVDPFSKLSKKTQQREILMEAVVFTLAGLGQYI